jgi:hypothetical protein
MPQLSYTAVTHGGQALEFEFPLHAHTRSAEAVGAMLSTLLEGLSKHVEAAGDVSDGDVLQAVAMLLAIRARMVDAASPQTLTQLCAELTESALAASQAARSYPVARA